MTSKRWFPDTNTIPREPGVYRWFDHSGRVLYVGKAKDLRSRLSSYFVDSSKLHERTRRMVASATSIDWTIVDSEFEALQLEFTWIKEFDPPYNVQFKDDKSYPYLAVSLGEEFPRAFLSRSRTNPNDKYFGPYIQAWTIRETIDSLLKVFPIRTCNKTKFENAKRSNRACMLAELGKCSAPCVGRITGDAHRELVKNFIAQLEGKNAAFMRRLESAMHEASSNLQFEKAARIRDQLFALDAINAKSVVVFDDNTSADLFAVAINELSAAVSYFKVREGRIRGAKNWVVDLETEREDAEILRYALQHHYSSEDDIAREILVPWLPKDLLALEEWLGKQGKKSVAIRVPKRGDKKDLGVTALKNAKHALELYKLKRSTDFTSRSEALANLQQALQLPELPLSIECFDVSHLAGTDIVASQVVFVDALPRKDAYRRFKISSSSDDTESIRQVITRRCAKFSLEETLPLIFVDGGQPQVNAAKSAAIESGFPQLQIFGIAKRLEEIWPPNSSFPIVLPRNSSELFLVQSLRDEAHRFAISHQRLRRKATIASALDDIPGLGLKKVRVLLSHFGSAKRISKATKSELMDVPGIGSELADAIIQTFA